MADKKLKVLMISEYPFSDKEQGHGGILQSTFHLIEGFELLDDPGLDLHVVSQTIACDRFETRKLGPITLHFVPKSQSEFGKFVLNPLRLLATVTKLSRRLRPDVIHGQGAPAAILASQILAKRSVQTIHGVARNEHAVLPRAGMSSGRRLRIAIMDRAEAFYMGRIRNLIAITREVESLVRKDTRGRARIFPTFIAIDPAFFRHVDKGNGAALRILFVAAITPRKGLHFLLEAFERLAAEFPQAELRIVGMWDWAPEYVESLRGKYRALVDAGRVHFTGSVGREQLFEEFAGADLFVLPSLSESAPAVVSQAMCMGLPIVTTRVGGIPDMVEDEATALLVPPSDPSAIYGALKRLTDDTALRARLGAAARQVAVTRYHPKSVAAATRDVYRAVAAAAQARSNPDRIGLPDAAKAADK